MATLQDAIEQIQDEMISLARMRRAPDKPPEQIAAFPFAVCYPESGEYTQRSYVMQGLHTIAIEVHVQRKDLPRDYSTAMTFAKSVPNEIFDAINGALSAIVTVGSISYTFGPMAYADVETLGFRFRLEGVKTEDAIS